MAEIKYTFSELLVTGKTNPIKLIALEGILDESNADDFAPKVYEVIEQMPEQTSVILDLEKLSYMNSKSIGYISSIYEDIAENDWNMYICNNNENVAEILDMVWMWEYIPMTKTIDEAIEALS